MTRKPGAAAVDVLWDATRCGAYLVLVPLVYLVNPSLKVSVSLLVGLSIVAPLETAIQAARQSWRVWRGERSDEVVTVEDRLAAIEQAVSALSQGARAPE